MVLNIFFTFTAGPGVSSLETLVRSSGTCIIHDIILYNRVNKRRALATGVSPHTSKWFHQRRSVDLATCTGAPFCMLHTMCGVSTSGCTSVGKHHGLDTLASPQRQAGVEVGVVAVERALDAVDAQEDEEQEAENRDRERLDMSWARGRVRRWGRPRRGKGFSKKLK